MNLVASVLRIFPNVGCLILSGSTGPDFIEGISDLDLIIIGPELADPLSQLKELVKINPVLDPIYIPQDNLDKSLIIGQKTKGEYELHSFDLYRLNIQGRLLYGDPKFLSLFPKISLDQALKDTLPYVQDVFIKDLLNKADEPISKNISQLLVISRAVYTIDRQSYGSKVTALDFLAIKYPEIKNLVLLIKGVYLKTIAIDTKPDPIEYHSFLNLARTSISNYLK